MALGLVDADPVNAHRGRHERIDCRLVDPSEAAAHAEIEYQGHRFLRDDPLADVAVGAHSTCIDTPGGLAADIPGNLARVAWGVIEAVGLVGAAIIPGVVEGRNARHGLLVGTTTVRIHMGDIKIVDGDEVCAAKFLVHDTT